MKEGGGSPDAEYLNYTGKESFTPTETVTLTFEVMTVSPILKLQKTPTVNYRP